MDARGVTGSQLWVRMNINTGRGGGACQGAAAAEKMAAVVAEAAVAATKEEETLGLAKRMKYKEQRQRRWRRRKGWQEMWSRPDPVRPRRGRGARLRIFPRPERVAPLTGAAEHAASSRRETPPAGRIDRTQRLGSIAPSRIERGPSMRGCPWEPRAC